MEVKKNSESNSNDAGSENTNSNSTSNDSDGKSTNSESSSNDPGGENKNSESTSNDAGDENNNSSKNSERKDTYLVNGNIYWIKYKRDLVINNRAVSLCHTCPHDSISEIVLHAYDNFTSVRTIINNLRTNQRTDYLNFIATYASIGEQEETYKLRAHVLFNCRNSIRNAVNCWDNIENQLEQLLRNTPSLTGARISRCRLQCDQVTTPLFILDVPCRLQDEKNFFNLLQFNVQRSLNPSVDDCGSCNVVKCCDVSIQLGPMIVLDVSYQFRINLDTKRRRTCYLSEIPNFLVLQSCNYELVGVIRYVDGNHFVPYCRSPDSSEWQERNDMKIDNIIRILTIDECNTEKMVLNTLFYVKKSDN